MHAVSKDQNVFRILVLGDSYVEGIQVSIEELFTRQLENLLNGSNNGTVKYEVINMGVSGYGTTQELLLLKDKGFIFSPDLVILCFNLGNDIRNNYIKLDQSTFDWDEAQRPYLDLTEGFAQLRLPGIKGLNKVSRRGWKYWIIDNFRIINIMHKRLINIEKVAQLTGNLSSAVSKHSRKKTKDISVFPEPDRFNVSHFIRIDT